jgi:hypothetical protein
MNIQTPHLFDLSINSNPLPPGNKMVLPSGAPMIIDIGNIPNHPNVMTTSGSLSIRIGMHIDLRPYMQLQVGDPQPSRWILEIGHLEMLFDKNSKRIEIATTSTRENTIMGICGVRKNGDIGLAVNAKANDTNMARAIALAYTDLEEFIANNRHEFLFAVRDEIAEIIAKCQKNLLDQDTDYHHTIHELKYLRLSLQQVEILDSIRGDPTDIRFELAELETTLAETVAKQLAVRLEKERLENERKLKEISEFVESHKNEPIIKIFDDIMNDRPIDKEIVSKLLIQIMHEHRYHMQYMNWRNDRIRFPNWLRI